MKKFLFNSEFKHKVIGFDLDGTLYDEFDFVSQVYTHIVNNFVGHENNFKNSVLEFMTKRWIEKGSSYPKIFVETKNQFDLANDFESLALESFRNFSPLLQLNKRTEFILDLMRKENRKLFLLTNGKNKLQNLKIDTLDIRHKFDKIIIAENHQKPDPYYATEIVTEFNCNACDVVFIGDSKFDREFCNNTGFYFIDIRDLW